LTVWFVVQVEPRRDDQNPSEERFVTIKGNSDACWRVSYCHYNNTNYIRNNITISSLSSKHGSVGSLSVFLHSGKEPFVHMWHSYLRALSKIRNRSILLEEVIFRGD